jgi:hypothetical protein
LRLSDDKNGASLAQRWVIEEPLRFRDCGCMLAVDLAVDGVALADGAVRVTRCPANRERLSATQKLGRQRVCRYRAVQRFRWDRLRLIAQLLIVVDYTWLSVTRAATGTTWAGKRHS